MSVVFGTNLVQNGGAESFGGTADGENIITPTDWTPGGDPTVAWYNAFFGHQIDIRIPNNGGNAFFTGGPDSSHSSFSQRIDLTSIPGLINAGQVNFSLSAALGGYFDNNDNAKVYVNFENAAGARISTASTGTVLATDRNNATKLLYRSDTGTIPASTSFAQVSIDFSRVDGHAGYNYGFADNVSLVLFTNTPSTAGIRLSLARSTLPAIAISGQRTTGGLGLNLFNASTSENIGPVSISLYASSDGTVDSSSFLLSTLDRHYSFGASKGAELNFPVKSLDVPAGTYTILAQTTDQYGTVDTAPFGPTIAIVPAVISLSASVGPISPATVTAGGMIGFTLTIQNAGNVSSSGSATIAVGLSSDGTTHSAPLATLIRRVTVKAGGSPLRLRIRVRVPADLSGTFDPFVTFTQGSQSVTSIGSSPVMITS